MTDIRRPPEPEAKSVTNIHLLSQLWMDAEKLRTQLLGASRRYTPEQIWCAADFQSKVTLASVRRGLKRLETDWGEFDVNSATLKTIAAGVDRLEEGRGCVE